MELPNITARHLMCGGGLSGFVPLCDWHHWSGHHSASAPPDPVIQAFAFSLVAVATIGVLASLVGGGLVVVLTRRIRDMFWAIPAANLLLFVAYLLLRSYPGGTAAQFRGLGLVYTLIALILLLLISLILASILALVRYLVRLARSSA